jgi:hypothetical protein
MLDRLKREGMVAVVRSEPQPRRPDRHIYAITYAGREELERWLASPSPPAAGYRDDLFLKLPAAAPAGGTTFHGVVRRERKALLAELDAPRRRTPPRWSRRGGGLSSRAGAASSLVRDEVGLAGTAHGAIPVPGDVLERGAGRDPAVGIALGRVVDESAGLADPLLDGLDGHLSSLVSASRWL